MKVGDKVTVYRKVLRHKDGQRSCWVPAMNNTIGMTFTIEEYGIFEFNPRLSNRFFYPKGSLKYA